MMTWESEGTHSPSCMLFTSTALANIHHFLTSALSLLVQCPLNGCALLR